MKSRLKLQPNTSNDVGRTRHQTLECYSSTQSGGLRNDRVALPVLHLSNAEENDNQTAHLSHKIRVDGENQTQNTTRPWANAVDNHDEMILPHLVIKPNIPPPQKLSSLLRARKTWNGTRIRPQGDTLGSHHNLQRRASSTNANLATFEATEMILLAEIDSDVRCATFLRQRAPRETLASYPDDSDSPQSQIHYKLRALERKIKMNKEKLAQVRERIAELGGNSDLLSIPGGPEQQKCITKQAGSLEDKPLSPALHARQEAKEITALPSEVSIASAVLVIQCSIRACRARRCLADLLAKTYQRVLNPSSNQYFYYNRITRSSQWEAPRLMHRCPCSLDAQPKPARVIISDPVLNAAAKTIQSMFRQRALRVFLKDLQLGNLEKVFDTGFGAWYYFNSRTNHSFWENVHHVRLTASNSAIYHRHQPWQTA